MYAETYEKTKKLLKKHNLDLVCYHNYIGLYELRVSTTLVANKTQEKYPTRKELHELVENAVKGFRECLK